MICFFFFFFFLRSISFFEIQLSECWVVNQRASNDGRPVRVNRYNPARMICTPEHTYSSM
jgi:hypothetical protein